MLNNLTLVGRLTKPVEVRKDKQGNSISTITLAVDHGKDDVSFIDCVAFGKQVDNLAQFCSKGNLIGVTGSLRQRKYTRKDGSQASVIEVLVNSIEFLEPKKEVPAPNPEEFATALPTEEERPPLADGWEYGEDGKPRKKTAPSKK